MTKNKGGAPMKPVNYTDLDKLCAMQCTGEECAAFLGIDYDTLNRHLKNDGNGGFTDYYKQKSAAGKISLRRKQYAKAIDEGNPTMLIWLGKQWLNQSEGADRGDSVEPKPLNISFTVEDARTRDAKS